MTEFPSDETPIEAKLAAPPPGLDHDSESDTPEPKPRMFQSRVAVLSILFLVTGAIGIPLLWASPHFSDNERFFWTFMVLLYTLGLLVMAGGIVWWAYARLFGAIAF